MNKLFLLILITLITTLGYAQKDLRSGYVITLSKDTLKGFVNYKEGSSIYESCSYYKSSNADPFYLGPNDIIGYGFVNEKYFESRNFTDKDGSSKREFLEVIVDGKASLYKGRDYYFVDKDDLPLTPLTNETEELFVNGERILKKSNKYIGTLNMLMSDCSKMKERIQKSKPQQRLLTTLLEDYNVCVGSPYITYKAKKPWFKGMVGASAGFNYSIIEFESKYGGANQLLGSFEKSFRPMAGISFDAFSPRVSERISFHAGAFYLNSTFYNYNKVDNGFINRIDYVSIDLEQIKTPIGLRYTFPPRTLTTYLTFGIAGTFHLNTSSHWVMETESDNVIETYTKEALAIKDSQFGYWGGLGMLRSLNSKLDSFIEIRFEKTNGIAEAATNPLSEITSTLTNFQLLIGIRTK